MFARSLSLFHGCHRRCHRSRSPGAWPARALLALCLAPALVMAAPIRILQDAGNTTDLSLSADGQRLVFSSSGEINGSNADHSWDVFSYSRATGQIQAVSNFTGGHLAGGNQSPRLSADGRTVLYQNYEARPPGILVFRTMVDTGNGGVPLADFGNHEMGALSANGQQALLNISNDGLRLFDLGDGSNRLLYGGFSLNFAFSGDGRWAARGGIPGDVQLIDVATGATRQIAAGNGTLFDADLAFSGDGHWLAFLSTLDLLGGNADRNAELFLANVDTGVLRQLTDSTGDRVLRTPVLSNDGTRLVFTSQRDLAGRNADGGEEAFLLDLDSDTLTQLSDGPAGIHSNVATISGDGRTVAWVSDDFSADSTVYLDTLPPRATEVPEPAGLAPLALAAALAAGRFRRRSGRGAPA